MNEIRQNKGFTLLEVMMSIFVFMIGMIGFVKFQIRSSEMIFDNESAQIAHTLAFNLLEDIDSMDSQKLRDMLDSIGGTTSDFPDSTLAEWMSTDATTAFSSGPYNSFGLADNSAGFKFYRRVSVQKYASNAIAGSGFYTQKNSPYDLLRQINVYVLWPRREYAGSTKCTNMSDSNFATECQVVKLSLLRPIAKEKPGAAGDGD